MVLPILAGAMAAGAGALALEPHYRNYQDRIRGRYAGGALEGVDRGDPRAVDAALLDAGLISGERFSSNLFAERQGMLDRASAELRTQMSTAPAWARIGMEQQALELERQQAADRETYTDWLIQNNGTSVERDLVSNPFTPASVKSSVAEGIIGRAVQSDADRIQEQAGILQAQNVAEGNAAEIETRAARERFVASLPQDQKQKLAAQAYGNPSLTFAPEDLDRIILDDYDTLFAPREGDAFGEYRDQVQPLVDDLAQYEWAISQLPEASQASAWFGSTEGLEVAQGINQLILKQRMDYWKNVLGRTDAPAEAEADQLAAAFPMLEPQTFNKGTTRALIERNLRQGLASSSSLLERAEGDFQRRSGSAPPRFEPTVPLPEGWTKAGGSE